MKIAETIRHNLMLAARRFPVATILSVTLFVFSVREYKDSAVYALLLCSIFFAISATLFAEARQLPRWTGIAGGIAISAGLFVIIAIPHSNFLGEFLLLPAAFASMFVAPFLLRDNTPEQFDSFRGNISAIMLLTFCVALAAWLGIWAILASLHYLFSVPVPNWLYKDTLLFCATFFAPLFAMGAIPRDFGHVQYEAEMKEHFIYGRLFAFLMPIYALILWAYGAKILLAGELPKGHLGMMVCVFAAISTWCYVVAFGQFAKAYPALQFWRRHFSWILIAPTLLAIVAIGKRISDYGVTEERYLVALMAAWLTGVIAIRFLRRREITPKHLITSAIAVIILASVGPWGMVAVSASSQMARLEHILQSEGMLVQGRIIPTRDEQAISPERKKNLRSIVRALTQSRQTHRLQPLFADTPDAHVHKEQSYYSATDILRDMGIFTYGNSASKSGSYYLAGANINAPNNLAIDGFEHISAMRLWIHDDNNKKQIALNDGLALAIDKEGRRLVLYSGEEGERIEELSFPLSQLDTALTGSEKRHSTQKNFFMDAAGPRYHARIYIRNATAQANAEGVLQYSNISLYLLYGHR